jgi:ATP-grasp domain
VQHANRLKVLLAASNWWPASARMALALMEHGCAVSAICPPGHPLRFVEGIDTVHTLRGFGSRNSLEAAIRRLQPDVVVPCDDRCVSQLHELHRVRPDLRVLVEHSLGDPCGFDPLERRSELLQAAQELGIRIAVAHTITSAAHASECYSRCSPTAVLKMDGTSGGEGVQIVRSAEEAAAGFECMRARLGMPTALKRFVINRDPLAFWSWGRRREAATTIQEFVVGTPANIMVACRNGQVLAEMSVQAVSIQGLTGAALVVQLIDNQEFSRAAALLAARFRISGFFGLDFMLERDTGAAYLIEMNPRFTQLGHLQLPQGDLAGAWCTALMGREAVRACYPIASDRIAFFPQAQLWGATSASAPGVHQDVPLGQQQLIKILTREPWPERQWPARIYHRFRRPIPMQAVEFPPTPDQ